jgi:ribonuclease E
MEISRQRRRTGVLEGTTHICPSCQGLGRIRSAESSALSALRAGGDRSGSRRRRRGGSARAHAVALYVLNEKRAYLTRLEQLQGLRLIVSAMTRWDTRAQHRAPLQHGRRRPRRRRAGRLGAGGATGPCRGGGRRRDEFDDEEADEAEDEPASKSGGTEGGEDGRPRRGRRRRGGRNRRGAKTGGALGGVVRPKPNRSRRQVRRTKTAASVADGAGVEAAVAPARRARFRPTPTPGRAPGRRTALIPTPSSIPSRDSTRRVAEAEPTGSAEGEALMSRPSRPTTPRPQSKQPRWLRRPPPRRSWTPRTRRLRRSRNGPEPRASPGPGKQARSPRLRPPPTRLP